MDRFIELVQLDICAYFLNLKSNMDRFIGSTKNTCNNLVENLKSNMDRFIGRLVFEYAMSNDI